MSIQEIDSNGKQTLVAHLTGVDDGPKSVDKTSNWDKKIISISTNKMDIEFRSDDFSQVVCVTSTTFNINTVFTLNGLSLHFKFKISFKMN